tara:strand:+ start:546 stop:1820 length:1275 start_codon:yes stop_codon:yes gene_type:complete
MDKETKEIINYYESQIGKDKYWQFICNPKHWNVQKKLFTRHQRSKLPLSFGENIQDDWAIPKKYKDLIKPGEMGVIRVGIDPRSNRELRNLKLKRLEPGYYATVQINEVFYGPTNYPELFTNPSDTKDEWRVKISVLQNHIRSPLTIKRLKKMRFNFDKVVFNPIQGVSAFQLSNNTYDRIFHELGNVHDTWLSDVELALNNLGGSAHLKDIYKEVFWIRDGNVNPTYTRTIQRELEENSQDSNAFKTGRKSTFYSVKGIGKGVWGLTGSYIGVSKHNETAIEMIKELNDQDDISTGYEKKVTIHKTGELQIIRTNPRLINLIKKDKDYTCEACGFNYEKIYGDYSDQKNFIEAHHIEPKSVVKQKAETGKKLKRSAKDFAILCANCHRMIHRMMSKDKGRIITLKELKRRISEAYKKKIKELN